MARWSGAIWQPVKQCSGSLWPIAVCLHHQAGSGNPAPIYASRNVSAHFWIPRAGQPVQHVDTAVQAWHGVTHNAYSIGVETEGCGAPPHAEPLNENQLNHFGALMAWANRTHGIPLVLSEAVTTPGFNYHRCQGGPSTACPCDVRKNARAEILRRAGASSPPTQEVDDMPTLGEIQQMIRHEFTVDPFRAAVYQESRRASLELMRSEEYRQILVRATMQGYDQATAGGTASYAEMDAAIAQAIDASTQALAAEIEATSG